MCENALILAQNLGKAAVGLYYIKKEKSHPISLPQSSVSFPTPMLFLNYR